LEKSVAEYSKTNPKAFWAYVKSKTTVRTGVADLKREDGSKTTTDKEKAELLNQFFQSVFTVEDDGPLPEPPEYNFDEPLTDFDISTEDVRKRLASLKTNKAAGPDGINPLILSKAADILSAPIAHLFKLTLATGQIPEEWRKATVTPIFKKGSRLSPGNYRPVSLTCILCKVQEAIIRQKIMDHLEKNKLISKHQHGFVSGRSCVTQLLEVMDTWTQILDEGGSIDVVYTDFMKAFDSVPHRRLLSKLSAHGIRGNVLSWISAFLLDRVQCVVVNGSVSSQAAVSSGIPQGSVLGPLLFVVYINDLPAQCQNTVKLFADDTKVFTRSDNDDAIQSLQEDLDSMQEWSDQWLLRFHPEKCHVVKLGHKKSDAVYHMKGKKNGEAYQVQLQESEVEKDLGVFVDNGLNFKEHVAKCTTKANQVVGVIRRSFDFLTEKLFVQLYKSLVRPILEYGHTAWQLCNKSLCSDVEDVQRRATKLLSSLRDLPYPKRLEALHLPCLEHRRLRGDMIDAYKYVHGLYDVDKPKLELAETRGTRGHSLKLAKGHCRLSVRSNFFSQRVINTWNSLPESVVTAPTVNSFKSRLDAFWKDRPSVYTPSCY
jgi:hypothetical protein